MTPPATPIILGFMGSADAGINKPLTEWLCDYCSMSEYPGYLVVSDHIVSPGPPDLTVPDECGTPILCMFYGLLFFIICLTIYSTVRGTKE